MSPQLAQERSLFTRVSAQARQAATVSAVAAGGQHADITAQLHLQAYSGSHAPSPPAAASTFVLDIDAQHLGAIGGKVGTTGGSIRRSTFLVSQVCAGGPTAALAAELSRQFAVPLVPWAAIAADITPPEQQEEREHSEVASGAKLQGRAFCFLPLPATTGLPVHVNAFFELSSNRRDIW
jgi:sacsin